jgi:uncharacterized protein (DUF2267 family)
MSNTMPMPFTYRSATEDYEKYLEDLRAISMLQTWNQCYTMTRSVFHVFRSHVEPQVALALRHAMKKEDYELMLKKLPPDAAAFWRTA